MCNNEVFLEHPVVSIFPEHILINQFKRLVKNFLILSSIGVSITEHLTQGLSIVYYPRSLVRHTLCLMVLYRWIVAERTHHKIHGTSIV